MNYKCNGGCIVCGQPWHENHHCDESTENRIEAARNAERNERQKNYGTRLEDGFRDIDDEMGDEMYY